MTDTQVSTPRPATAYILERTGKAAKPEKTLRLEIEELVSPNNAFVEEAEKILADAQAEDLALLRERGWRPTFAEAKRNTLTLESIQKLAVDYHLRFLPLRSYNGLIDAVAIQKLKEFEQKPEVVAAVRSYDNSIKRSLSNRTPEEPVQYFILAPAEMFKLQKLASRIPDKDPVLVALFDGQYYHIHTWGEDLSAKRKRRYFLLRDSDTWSILVFLALTAGCIYRSVTSGNYLNLLGILAAFFVSMCFALALESTRLFSNTVWNSDRA